MSLEILLEAALFVERQTQGEEPNGRLEHQTLAEEVKSVDGIHSSYVNVSGQEEVSSANGYSAEHQVSSVIQRLRPSSYANGVGVRNNSAASFYSYQQERSRSPSPARGNCNGTTSRSAASPPHSVSNSSSGTPSQRSYQSSPKMPETDLTSQSSQFNQSAANYSYRVDDLASRSHRLEEALLRASRKSPPAVAPSSQQFHAGSSNGSGRNSAADELLELKKRTGAGTREVHNKLEKNRRAHLRECFEFLRKQLPAIDDKKLSNLGILKSALRYIQSLKRKEREYEHTMERLAREKIAAQQRLAGLRKEVCSIPGYTGDAGSLDLGSVLPVLHSKHTTVDRDSPLTLANVQAHNLREENHFLANAAREADQETNSTSTASEGGGLSDGEEPSSFQEAYSRAGPGVVYNQSTATNGTSPVSPVTSAYSESNVNDARPHIKYVRAASSIAGSSANQAAFLTMTSPGVLELTGLAGVNPVLTAHHNVQFLGSSLKVLTPAGTSMAGLRVITAEASPSSLQSMMTVYPSSTSGGKTNEEISPSLINGTASTAGGFCIPAGVVIPNLVALPPETTSSATTITSSYDAAKSQPQVSHFKHSSSVPSSPTVLSLPNGFKATVNRSLQPSSSSGVTQVITPITVTRSLPLVTQMAVMQPAKHVAHVITASAMDKVPILKSGSIPIIGGQYLTSPVTRQVIKPVVVVATPSPSPSPTPGTIREAVPCPSTPQSKNPP